MAQKYYYKFLDKDMTTNHNNKVYHWKIGVNRLKNVRKGAACGHGLHVYKILKNCSFVFYPRVFKCKIGKIYGENEYIVRTNKVILIKELEPSKVKDSRWAFYYCGLIEDREDIRKNITNSYLAFRYCRDVKDRKEVWKNITDSEWAYKYCKTVKDRKEVWKNITDSEWAYRYCKNIKDRKEVWKNISEPFYSFMYCRYVKDRKEIRKLAK